MKPAYALTIFLSAFLLFLMSVLKKPREGMIAGPFPRRLLFC
jgi:hypothetical protein